MAGVMALSEPLVAGDQKASLASLCSSVGKALRGNFCLGSYSVVQCIRYLTGQPLYGLAANAGVWGERGSGDGSSP